jgi:hypothetical protein
MTRLWPDGESIEVRYDSPDTPQAFTWRGKTHVVQGIAIRWRVDADWWRVRIWREYFKLYTHSGLLVVLYHDLVKDQWTLQRLYD